MSGRENRLRRRGPMRVWWSGTLAAISLIMAVGELSAAPGALEEGIRLFNDGQLDEAEAEFREALDADPGSGEAKLALARTLAVRGRAAMQASNWSEAKRYLERAIEIRGDQAEFHLLLAVILFRQRDFYYSRYAVKKALEFEPANPPAHELLGDIQYQDGYLDLAIPEWEAALPGARNPEMLRAKIEKTRKEMDVEQEFGKDSSRHYILLYDGIVPREVSEMVLDRLEEAYDAVRRELGSAPPSDITVILYTGSNFQEVTRSPRWAGGAFDGKVRIPVGGLSTEEDAARLGPILAHEVTHAFLRGMVPQGLPLWFEEGLAEYFEGVTAVEAKTYLEHHPLGQATLDYVALALSGRGQNVQAGYYAAGLALWTLIDAEGFGAVRRILEEMSSGTGFEKALEDEARLTAGELQELWRKELP